MINNETLCMCSMEAPHIIQAWRNSHFSVPRKRKAVVSLQFLDRHGFCSVVVAIAVMGRRILEQTRMLSPVFHYITFWNAYPVALRSFVHLVTLHRVHRYTAFVENSSTKYASDKRLLRCKSARCHAMAASTFISEWLSVDRATNWWSIDYTHPHIHIDTFQFFLFTCEHFQCKPQRNWLK